MTKPTTPITTTTTTTTTMTDDNYDDLESCGGNMMMTLVDFVSKDIENDVLVITTPSSLGTGGKKKKKKKKKKLYGWIAVTTLAATAAVYAGTLHHTTSSNVVANKSAKNKAQFNTQRFLVVEEEPPNNNDIVGFEEDEYNLIAATADEEEESIDDKDLLSSSFDESDLARQELLDHIKGLITQKKQVESYSSTKELVVMSPSNLSTKDDDDDRMWWERERDSIPETGDEELDLALRNFERLHSLVKDESSNNAAMRKAVDEMHKKLFKGKDDLEVAGKIASEANGIAKAVFGAWEKFESGDTNQIVIGSMEVLAAASKMIPKLGPFIELGATIVGGIFGVHHRNDQPPVESTESIVQRVVERALQDFGHNQLKAELQSTMSTIIVDNMFLEEEFFVVPESRTETDLIILQNRLASIPSFRAGVGMMGRLMYHINDDGMTPPPHMTSDKDTANKVVDNLSAYIHLHMLREKQVYLVGLLASSLGAHTTMETDVAVLNRHIDEDKTNFDWLARPYHTYQTDFSSRLAISTLHTELSGFERRDVEFFLNNVVNRPLPGVAVRLLNIGVWNDKNRNEYLGTPEKNFHKLVSPTDADEHNTLFRLVGGSLGGEGGFALWSPTNVGFLGKGKYRLMEFDTNPPGKMFSYNPFTFVIRSIYSDQSGFLGTSKPALADYWIEEDVPAWLGGNPSGRRGDNEHWAFVDEFGNPVVFATLPDGSRNGDVAKVCLNHGCTCRHDNLFDTNNVCRDKFSTKPQIPSKVDLEQVTFEKVGEGACKPENYSSSNRASWDNAYRLNTSSLKQCQDWSSRLGSLSAGIQWTNSNTCIVLVDGTDEERQKAFEMLQQIDRRFVPRFTEGNENVGPVGDEVWTTNVDVCYRQTTTN